MVLIDFRDVSSHLNFYFQHSLRPFKAGYSLKYHEWLFLDIENKDIYTIDELEKQDLYFYNDDKIGEMAVRIEY